MLFLAVSFGGSGIYELPLKGLKRLIRINIQSIECNDHPEPFRTYTSSSLQILFILSLIHIWYQPFLPCVCVCVYAATLLLTQLQTSLCCYGEVTQSVYSALHTTRARARALQFIEYCYINC